MPGLIEKPRIVVVGSINMDLVLRCNHLPKPGETVLATSLQEYFGGKGANQAVAASRAGAEVQLVGKVGNDAYAEKLLENLERCGVDQAMVAAAPCSSGLAFIPVDKDAENSIVVLPGANAELTAHDILDAKSAIEGCDLLLLQLEVPANAVCEAIAIAKRAGVPIVLDPAPAPKEWNGLFFDVDWMCPNESEASALLGREVHTAEDAVLAVKMICDRGVKNAVVTRGSSGTIYYNGSQLIETPVFPIVPVDTTAAGDAFAGALAVAIALDMPPQQALRFASAAGAIACTRLGAQTALASRAQIESMLDEALVR